LLVAIAPFVLATIVGGIVLWPAKADLPEQVAGGTLGDEYKATITKVEKAPCGAIAQGGAFVCYEVTAELEEGPDAGTDISFSYASGRGVRTIVVGDRIILASFPNSPTEVRYQFVDFQRSTPLVLLAVLFAVAVIATSRGRGLAALAGLALSILVLVKFILPAILAGENPLAVSIVGSAAIMFVALYLAHGVNARTSTAVLGTLASLALTGGLALLFVGAARFTGLASEEATFLQVSADQINLQGLLLGGIIIGALGVLDDVTITQSSAVWEIHDANPSLGSKALYGKAINIGRDHIASTVNTLVLAYVGASLPLMIIFTISSIPVSKVLTSEVVSEEIVRTLVGSIGLVASVPVTTALAVLAVKADHRPRGGHSPPDPAPAPDLEPEHDSVRIPRAERAWRE
jgi:uncharacterized membrane protein